MIPLLKLVLNYLPNNYKRQFFLAFSLLLISAIAEILSIASVVPFLGLLEGGPDSIRTKFIVDLLPPFLSNNANYLLINTLIFGLATAFAAVVRLFSIWFNSFLCTCWFIS